MYLLVKICNLRLLNFKLAIDGSNFAAHTHRFPWSMVDEIKPIIKEMLGKSPNIHQTICQISPYARPLNDRSGNDGVREPMYHFAMRFPNAGSVNHEHLLQHGLDQELFERLSSQYKTPSDQTSFENYSDASRGERPALPILTFSWWILFGPEFRHL